MIINRTNFHSNTKATFEYKSSSLDKLIKQYGKPNHNSETGSKYWYLEEGVIRWSDHWGKVKDCKWKMSRAMKHSYSNTELKGGFIGGYCLFTNFTN